MICDGFFENYRSVSDTRCFNWRLEKSLRENQRLYRLGCGQGWSTSCFDDRGDVMTGLTELIK